MDRFLGLTEGPGPPQEQDGEPGMHHGGSFRTYMDHKNLKLREQFELQAAHQQGGQQSQLFKGVSIWVNGYTVPSHQASGWRVYGSALLHAVLQQWWRFPPVPATFVLPGHAQHDITHV